MRDLGAWDGDLAGFPSKTFEEEPPTSRRTVVLDTWRLMIDDGRGQDGQLELKATARPAVLRASEATLKAFDVDPGGMATLSTETGSISFPTEVADLPDGVVWAPANSGTSLRTALGAGYADHVTLGGGAS
jgi:NADH-quinone oxidoreductase subunit G